MKKIIIIISVFTFLASSIFGQDDSFGNYSLFHVSKTEKKTKSLQKRFDKAAIYRDYFYQDGFYYMELDESDYDDYFEILSIKIRVIKKKHKKRIETFIILKADDTNTTVDKEIDLNRTL